MCVRWTKFVGSPIMLRSILLLFLFGGGLATTQQPILCQNWLIPGVWQLRPSLSLATLQAVSDTAVCKSELWETVSVRDGERARR